MGITDEQRRALQKPILVREFLNGQYVRSTINDEEVQMTRSYRVECVRCLQLIGPYCCQPVGYVAYIPALRRRRAICLDCLEIRTVERDKETDNE